MRGALVTPPNLVMGLGQHHHAAGGREHDVVVQVLAHGFVKTARLFIDRRRGILQVVRPDDRGVTTRVAAAQPALFDDRHIGDPEILAQVKGGGQPVPTGTDDDYVVFLFRLGGERQALSQPV